MFRTRSERFYAVLMLGGHPSHACKRTNLLSEIGDLTAEIEQASRYLQLMPTFRVTYA